MSILDLLAADKNLNDSFRKVFCEATHTAPQEAPKRFTAQDRAVETVDECIARIRELGDAIELDDILDALADARSFALRAADVLPENDGERYPGCAPRGGLEVPKW